MQEIDIRSIEYRVGFSKGVLNELIVEFSFTELIPSCKMELYVSDVENLTHGKIKELIWNNLNEIMERKFIDEI